MRTVAFLVLSASVPASLVAQPAAVVAETVQQQFDAASEALERREWQLAHDRLAALEARLVKGKPNPRILATIRLRKGKALFGLNRDAEAGDSLKQGLDVLPSDDAVLTPEIREGWIILGRIAARSFDYPRAVTNFQKAAAMGKTDVERVLPLLDLVRYGMWTNREAARAALDEVDAILLRTPKADPQWTGLARRYRGRLLLNEGRNKEARVAYDQSIKAFGGLKFGKVDYLDTSARGDAAIAALRDGDEVEAKRYLAYAGAAQQSNLGFEMGREMEPPECGGALDLRPEDVAVVEFGISDQGAVIAAEPVFFSGEAEKAVAYAQAASNWTWSSEELKRVNPFFRLQTRIEVRCTKVFNRPSPAALLTSDFSSWLASSGIDPLPALPTNSALRQPVLESELKQRESRHGIESLNLLPVLYLLASSPLTNRLDADAYAARANEIARQSKAPTRVRALFEISDYLTNGNRSWNGFRANEREKLVRLVSHPDYVADRVAYAAVTLTIYDSLNPNARKREGEPLLRGIIDDKGLNSKDPMRVGALIRLANLASQSGQITEARSYFERTGLDEQQCALVDARPRMTGGTINDNDYPADALKWGMGGWTVAEFDIRSDGKTEGVRPLIAFPPFVFGAPTARQLEKFRFEQSYRPNGGLGCGGQRQRVTYRSGIRG